MKLHPFDDTCVQANKYVQLGYKVFQQFNCAHCGIKQTMEDANVFHKLGKCEECGKETNIEKDGCNYMVMVDLKERTHGA